MQAGQQTRNSEGNATPSMKPGRQRPGANGPPTRGRRRPTWLPAVAWYFREIYASHEGPCTLPFYCDPARVGAFAVSREDLSVGRDAKLFRLFVGMSMFQALRDVVIMRQQRALPRSVVRALADEGFVKRLIAKH